MNPHSNLQELCVTILKDLVRIDTTNPPGNERTALEYIAGVLRAHGISHGIQKTGEGRGNLAAVLPASDGCNPGENLVLLSHIDVVGAVPSQWSHPPFAADETEDGNLWGRGTLDTKQLTVMQLLGFLSLSRCKEPRSRTVFFVVTSDEECGSRLGLCALLEGSVKIGGRAYSGKEIFCGASVISEGGGFPIEADRSVLYLCETGQKGAGQVSFTVPARDSKGAFFQSGDGMIRAARLIERLAEYRHPSGALETTALLLGALCKACSLASDLTGEEAIVALEGHVSPFLLKVLRAMTRNSLTVTLLEGRNLNEVRLTADLRLLPGYGEDYVRGMLDPLAQELDFSYQIDSFCPGYESRCEGGLFPVLRDETVRRLALHKTQTTVLPFVSMGSSDGRHLVDCGCAVYGYSPVFAWDATFDRAVGMVHGVDEHIHRDSLLLGTEILTDIILRYATERKDS